MTPVPTELTSLAQPGSQLRREAWAEAARAGVQGNSGCPHALQGNESPQGLGVADSHVEINSHDGIAFPKNSCMKRGAVNRVQFAMCPYAWCIPRSDSSPRVPPASLSLLPQIPKGHTIESRKGTESRKRDM